MTARSDRRTPVPRHGEYEYRTVSIARDVSRHDAARMLTEEAEYGLVSQLHASGGGRLVAFTCVDGQGNTLMPCGRCRQLLWEHGGAKLLVDSVSGIKPMSEVLPDAFGPDDLSDYAEKSKS